MIYPEQSVIMRKALDTVLSGNCADMESGPVFMNHREIPNFQMRRRGPKLKSGMTLAIEPMVNLGTERIRWMSDNWTVGDGDRKESAHYENTILITKDEPKILSIADGNV